MRHIDDIKYETMACLTRAKEINDAALINGLEFILETLQEYQGALRYEEELRQRYMQEQQELQRYLKIGGTE